MQKMIHRLNQTGIAEIVGRRSSNSASLPRPKKFKNYFANIFYINTLFDKNDVWLHASEDELIHKMFAVFAYMEMQCKILCKWCDTGKFWVGETSSSLWEGTILKICVSWIQQVNEKEPHYLSEGKLRERDVGWNNFFQLWWYLTKEWNLIYMSNICCVCTIGHRLYKTLKLSSIH